jgi:hypothetical protein
LTRRAKQAADFWCFARRVEKATLNVEEFFGCTTSHEQGAVSAPAEKADIEGRLCHVR